MTKTELTEILEQHRLYLLDNKCGQRANLRGVDLECVDLRGADLRGANLRDANLECADLRGADLRWVDLEDADLKYADLRSTDLRGTDLSGASFRYTRLCGANLEAVNLEYADLGYADVRGITGALAFKLDQHLAIWTKGQDYIKVGCYYKTIDHWIEFAPKMGKRNKYTDEQIDKYLTFFKLCKENNDD